MSSALAKSSGAIWYSAAAAFSATCLGRVAPIIAEDTSCLRNTQASANWAKLTPASLSAISFTCCTAVNRGLAATVSAALRPLTHGRPGIPPAAARLACICRSAPPGRAATRRSGQCLIRRSAEKSHFPDSAKARNIAAGSTRTGRHQAVLPPPRSCQAAIR